MRKRITQVTAALALFGLGISLAMAQDDLPIPADEFVYCTVCHGIQLMGNRALEAPRLSGMEPWYVEQQLLNFKERVRGVHVDDPFGFDMLPMAAALSEEQIHESAAFVGTTRSPAPDVTITGDVEKGRIYYSTCAACHGVDGSGNEALGTPGLLVPDDWYQVQQMKNFKSGSRGSHPGDTYGMQMRAAAQLLADEQAIIDVVSYISTLQNN